MSTGNQGYARLNIIVGTNGTGKSTFVDKILAVTHFKNAIVYIESIDAGGTPFKGLPVIQLADYRGGKVCIDADDISFPTLIKAVSNSYKDGLFIIDEAGMYQHEMFDKGAPIPAFKKLLKQRRKYNVEIYLIYHGASEIPVQLFKWANNVILFHQTEEFRHKAHLIPNAAALQAAQRRIKEKYFAGNLHYCERVQLS